MSYVHFCSLFRSFKLSPNNGARIGVRDLQFEGFIAEDARVLILPGIQPGTKPTMSHHFEHILLAFTAILN